jgi:hypothetical protein
MGDSEDRPDLLTGGQRPRTARCSGGQCVQGEIRSETHCTSASRLPVGMADLVVEGSAAMTTDGVRLVFSAVE